MSAPLCCSMPDGHAAFEIDADRLQLIAEGGTRRVYLHPLYPGLVFKRFKERPSGRFLELLVGNVEFADYLAGKVRILDALMHSAEGGSWRETLLCQPHTDVLEKGFSVGASYWELRPDLLHDARTAGGARRVVEIMDEAEPAAPRIRRLCTRHPDFTEKLRLLYEQVFAYLGRTGMIIDFAGAHNVVAFCNSDWDIEVLDAVKGDRLRLRDTSEAPGSDAIGLHDTAAALNVCAFFRMVFFLEDVLTTDAISHGYWDRWEAALSALQSPGHDPLIQALREAHGLPTP